MTVDAPSLTLQELGWNEFFAQQLSAQESREEVPARVFAVQRNSVVVMFEGGSAEAAVGGRWYQLEAEARPTIGDWLLLDAQTKVIRRLLQRRSLLKRVAAGREHEVQLLAANIDTMFLVSSCNEEFNPSRLERYLALAIQAGVQPVVVLTKADQCDAPQTYVDTVRTLQRDLPVELVDARDPSALDGVRKWCRVGQTVALLGSSGVGKSTLVNSLAGIGIQLTGDIREDDAKGRHTTTARSLHVLPDGGLLVDNPGMRELSLTDADLAAGRLFEDIEALAGHCRFRDCRHDAEPGCAVRAALETGALEQRRLDSYRKLGAQRDAPGRRQRRKDPNKGNPRQ